MWFASYQTDRSEVVDLDRLAAAGFSVVFQDSYRPVSSATGPDGLRVSCPLNGAASVEGGCQRCGRCWTPAAVTMRDEDSLRRWAEHLLDRRLATDDPGGATSDRAPGIEAQSSPSTSDRAPG
jgi:hypothetical protein